MRMPESSAELNGAALRGAANIHEIPRSSAAEQQVVKLFDDLRERLLRYLLGFSLDISDAEDILQETFLALFEHLRRGRPRHHLQGWLFKVAHNLALRHRRARRDSQMPHAFTGGYDAPVVCSAPNPEDQLLSSQTQERLIAALQTLPEQSRWCLYLRAEGLRYREIAEILEISLGSVSGCLENSLAYIARAINR